MYVLEWYDVGTTTSGTYVEWQVNSVVDADAV